MSMLFAYMAGGDGVVRGLKMFCHRGSEFFLLAFVCMYGGGGQVQYLSFREKNNRPPPIGPPPHYHHNTMEYLYLNFFLGSELFLPTLHK